MRRAVVGAAGAALAGFLAAQGASAFSSSPNTGNVQASFTASEVGFPTTTPCLGADGVTMYQKQLRTWKGTITDLNPTKHKYPLTGSIKIDAILTTYLNTSQGTGLNDGVATGALSITNTKGGLVAQGPFTLLINYSDMTGAPAIFGRGMINVPLYGASGKKTPTSLIANLSFGIDGSTNQLTGTTGSLTHYYWNESFGNFADEFNNQAC